jgi:hypothetical protein
MKPILLMMIPLICLLPTSLAAGPDHPTLNWGSQVNAGVCETDGPPVINVNFTILNTVDSGEAGNYWAYDTINRSVQVWQQTNGSFCAEIRDKGKFDSQLNQESPGDTGLLSGDEDGTFQGGYVLNVTSTLLDWPTQATRGNIGVFDYNCDLSGTCPGYENWLSWYFSSYTGSDYSYMWWGWVYHNRSNTWVNSSDGNAGDVIP